MNVREGGTVVDGDLNSTCQRQKRDYIKTKMNGQHLFAILINYYIMYSDETSREQTKTTHSEQGSLFRSSSFQVRQPQAEFMNVQFR